MFYFYLCLFLSLGICLALLLLVLKRLKINALGQNQYKESYFLPILIAGLLASFIIFDLQARILDLSDILSDNCLTLKLSSENYQQEGNKLLINGERYFLSPIHKKLDTNKLYKFKLTKYSHICLSSEEIDSLN